METVQPLPDFFRSQEAERFGEGRRFEIQEQRNSNRLQVANAFGCLDWRAGENARAPWLIAQLLRKLWRELFQLINVSRLADERKSQSPNLREIAIVNFQAFNRFEPAGKEIQDLAI